jgi:ribosomal protein L37AE/L43A
MKDLKIKCPECGKEEMKKTKGGFYKCEGCEGYYVPKSCFAITK